MAIFVQAEFCFLMAEPPARRTVSSTLMTSLILTSNLPRPAVRGRSALDLSGFRYTATRLWAQECLVTPTYQKVYCYFSGRTLHSTTPCNGVIHFILGEWGFQNYFHSPISHSHHVYFLPSLLFAFIQNPQGYQTRLSPVSPQSPVPPNAQCLN